MNRILRFLRSNSLLLVAIVFLHGGTCALKPG